MYDFERDPWAPEYDVAANDALLCNYCGSHFLTYPTVHPRCPECGTEATAEDPAWSDEVDELVGATTDHELWSIDANPGDHLRIVTTDWLTGDVR